jgi:hypothetical protein
MDITNTKFAIRTKYIFQELEVSRLVGPLLDGAANT